jgi:uncharacterized membrane protein
MFSGFLGSGFTLVLAAVLLCLGVVQMIKPFSGAPINPLALIAAALLLFVRYGLVRQRQRRMAMLDKVPKKPLGLSDD